MSRNGFSSIELLVALVLGAIVSAVVFRLMMGHQRLFTEHAARAEENATHREAFLILRSELAGLGGGASDADLVAMSPSAIRYRAFRSLGFLCRSPETATRRLTLDASWIGMRATDEAVDSVLIFADGTISDDRDDRWLSANVSSASGGNDCPGGRPSLTLTVTGVTGRDLARVHWGAPVRSFAIWEARSYRDRRGDWWLGMRRWGKVTGRWPAIQPVLGPLAPGGVAIEFLDRAGAVTGNPREVALMGFQVAPRRRSRGPDPLGVRRVLVALRNR
jgi:hypothetical protein